MSWMQLRRRLWRRFLRRRFFKRRFFKRRFFKRRFFKRRFFKRRFFKRRFFKRRFFKRRFFKRRFFKRLYNIHPFPQNLVLCLPSYDHLKVLSKRIQNPLTLLLNGKPVFMIILSATKILIGTSKNIFKRTWITGRMIDFLIRRDV